MLSALPTILNMLYMSRNMSQLRVEFGNKIHDHKFVLFLVKML